MMAKVGAELAIAFATLGSAAFAMAIGARRPWLGTLALLVLGGALAFEMLTAASLLTAITGHYSPWIVCGITGAYLLAGIHAVRRIPLRLPTLRVGRGRGLAMLAVVGYGLVTTWGASEQILGGQDPGVYVAIAGDLTRAGTIHHTNDALAAVPESLAERIVQPAIAQRHRIVLSGTYVDDHDPARANPQFIHGFPALMAIFKNAFGLTGMLRVPVLMGILSILALSLLGSELFALAAAGIVAALLLGTNLAQLYFARNPFTEVPNQLFFLVGAWLAVLAVRKADATLAILASLAWSSACLIRPDAYLVFPLALVALSWIQPESFRPSLLRAFAFSALLGCIAAVALSGPTSVYGYLFNGMQYQAWAAVLFAVAFALIAPWLWRLDWVQQVRRQIYSRRGAAVLGWSAAAILVTTVAWGYWIRPHSIPAICDTADCYHMLGVRLYDEDTFVRLSWYVSPIGLAVATLGVALLIRRHLRLNDGALLVVIAVGLGYSALFLWQQMNSPMHFWAFRRYVPMVLPFCVLAIAYAIVALASRGRAGIAAAALLLLFLVAYGIRTSAPFMKTREMQGSHAFLRDIARSLPPRAVLATMVRDAYDSQIFLPLQSLFGVDILPIAPDGSSDQAVEEAIAALKANREVLFVCSDDASCQWNPTRWAKKPRSASSLTVPRSEQTLDRVPAAFGGLELNFTTFELVPKRESGAPEPTTRSSPRN